MELTKSQREHAVYIDLNNEYGPGGTKLLVVDEVAIQKKIQNVLTTPKFSLVFEPLFGCDLERLLHEPHTPKTARKAEAEVLSSLTEWVKEIIIGPQDISVTLDDPDPAFFIDLGYRYRTAPTVEGQVSFRFER